MPASHRTAHPPATAPRAHGERERGATLVEMALVVPIFLLLVFAILEFAFYLGQINEARHVAREGARVAGVAGDAGDVDDAICGAIVLVDPEDLTYTLSGSSNEVGGSGVVTVAVEYESLTGFLNWLPLGPFDSQHDFFVEPNRSVPGGGGC